MKNRIFKVEKLVHGGMGIVRDDSHAVFVPFVIPGEEVKIRIEEGSKKPVRAELIEVVSASSDRVVPPCPLFGNCGGCQFQHISYPAQLKYKTDILAESLAWIAKIKPPINPIIASPMEHNYRSRIRMHVRRGKAGFFAAASNRLVPVTYCYITNDTINRAIPSLGQLIESGNPETIELVHEEDSVSAIIENRREQKKYRLALNDGKESGKWAPAPDLKVAFQQVNPDQNEALRSLIRQSLSDMKIADTIELYAGSGNLTETILPYSSNVFAVESDAAAVSLGEERFGRLQQKNLSYFNMSAEAFLGKAIEEGMKPELIVLDPPRIGAKESIPAIVKLEPERIIYVSCDPATLSRDIKGLLSENYKVISITPVDMFPQTSHIETVAVLSRK